MLVGVGGFGVSFLLFNLVIVRVDAGWAAVVLNLIPVFAFLSAVIFLGEGVTRSDAVGGALVGASVLYFLITDRREAGHGLQRNGAPARPPADASPAGQTVVASPPSTGMTAPVT